MGNYVLLSESISEKGIRGANVVGRSTRVSAIGVMASNYPHKDDMLSVRDESTGGVVDLLVFKKTHGLM